MPSKRKIRYLERALIAPPLVFSAFVIGGFAGRFLGNCQGGLGVGLKCPNSDFLATYAGLAEVSLIIAIPLTFIYVPFCLLTLWVSEYYWGSK